VTGFRIRRAVAADAPAIAALREEAAQWLTGRGISQWHPGEVGRVDVLGWLTTGRVYVAELFPSQHQASVEAGVVLTGEVVGSVRLAWSDVPVWGDRPADAGYVQALMTARRAAGQGLGRQLLAHAERVITDSGRPLARLCCLRGNRGLEAFYRSAGYAEIGTRTFQTPGWDPVTLMQKALGSPGSAS
jgi:ribosomal protein S18 acetylase RimI-like enzyme